ncbi:MAG: SixA phosphatase family protein [Gemmatimonadota bacterium]
MSEGGGRTLVVLRHAKAAHEPALADEDRPLTGRGRRDAAAAGAWLRGAGLIPGLVLCSPARRTRETWQQVSGALAQPDGPAAEFDRRLYTAGADGLLDAVRETAAGVEVLLLVGHNPASHQLVYDLTGECDSFPTAALAVISLPGGWADAAPGAGTLARFWSPRG